jgi:hypothetical protein
MSHWSAPNSCQRKVPFHVGPLVSLRPWTCLPASRLPEGPEWTYEIKLDGYRLEAVRSGGQTTRYTQQQNTLNQKFHYIATPGSPDYTALTNFCAAGSTRNSLWISRSDLSANSPAFSTSKTN